MHQRLRGLGSPTLGHRACTEAVAPGPAVLQLLPAPATPPGRPWTCAGARFPFQFLEPSPAGLAGCTLQPSCHLALPGRAGWLLPSAPAWRRRHGTVTVMLGPLLWISTSLGVAAHPACVLSPEKGDRRTTVRRKNTRQEPLSWRGGGWCTCLRAPLPHGTGAPASCPSSRSLPASPRGDGAEGRPTGRK